MAAESSAQAPAHRSMLLKLRHDVWRIIVLTVGTCMRNRVTGLAAEAAFFAILSLPPLIFALAGSIGYVFAQLNNSQIDDVRHTVLDLASRALTPETVDDIIRPTLNDVLEGGRYDVISIGFILALWSGSRALNVFVDTITIMYGLGGHRGIIRTRALSFLLYVLGMVTGVVTIPLVVAGPRVVAKALPERLDFLNQLYWPTVILLCVCFLTTLYHVSVPVRTAWRYNVPGAVFSMFCWIVGSAVLRSILVGTARGSTSIYGPLATPIAVLLWLYILSIAVLIGAALNAAFDQIWPQKEITSARSALLQRLSLDTVLPWRGPHDESTGLIACGCTRAEVHSRRDSCRSGVPVSAERVSRLEPWVGCVVGGEPGVARVLTDLGEVRASYGGAMLARIACDRGCVPAPGHWVVLRRWCDDRITIEDTWVAPASAKVIPLHRAR